MSDAIRIRVLTVDDHPLMREGIAAVIHNEPDMELVAEASTASEGIGSFRRLVPDITLMDVRLPDMSGIEALAVIRKEFPAARILMLTTFEGDAEIRRAVNAGARGYILKTTPRKAITDAIRRVHAGKSYMPVEVAEQLAQYMGDEPLSKREIDVIRRVAEGNRNIDVANLLFISEETVKGHLKHIMEKLGARDRTEAVAIAVRRGIIHL